MTKPAKSRKQRKWKAWAILNKDVLQHEYEALSVFDFRKNAEDGMLLKGDQVIPVTITEGHRRKI